jgi:hypothetical protein
VLVESALVPSAFESFWGGPIHVPNRLVSSYNWQLVQFDHLIIALLRQEAMPSPLTTSRAARERRIVAASIWFSLIVVAMILWNTRTQRLDISNPTEPVAFVLAAFTTFVSLFAWMLFNPARGVSAETPTLMLAGMATMFPPCVIAFCTMPPGSPLSGWLTTGLFLLLLIAVMSPVPDEFFGIPRDRHSYMQSASALSISEQFVVDHHPDWLPSADLMTAVSGSPRPSLAPRSWREENQLLPRSPRRRTPTEVISEPKERVPPEEPRRRTAEADRPKTRLRDSVPSANRGVEKSGLPVDPSPESEHRGRHSPQSRRDVGDVPRDSVQEQKAATKTGHDPGAVEPFTTEFQRDDDHVVIPLADSRRATAGDIQVADRSRQTGFERIRDELGGEMIEGTVFIHFSRGQKRANVHVPFSPPLQGAPKVECTAVEHDSLRVKVPECRAWGIRIEGRRTHTSRVEDVEVAFSAVHVAAT